MRAQRVAVALVLTGWMAFAAEEPKKEEKNALPPRDVRTWTSASGSTVEARLVFNYGVWVQLEEPDGSRLHIRCVYLSAEDKEYLRSFGPTKLSFWQEVKAPDPDLIDINSCSIAQLKMLPRIGETLARSIVRGRPYRRTKDLMDVPGIGEKTFEVIRDDITARRVKPEPRRAGG
jgi:hypothetical protein